MELQGELERTAAGFQAQIAALDGENRAKTEWARQLDGNLAAASGRIVALQGELEDRSRWAHDLDRQLEAASARIVEVQAELGTDTGMAAWKAALRREPTAFALVTAKVGAHHAVVHAGVVPQPAFAEIHDLEDPRGIAGPGPVRGPAHAFARRIVGLQVELEQSSTGYRAKVAALEHELEQRTGWARGLAGQLADGLSRVAALEGLAASTQTKLEDLEAEVCAKTEWGQQLTADLEASDRRAQELDRALAASAARAAGLEAEIDAKAGRVESLEADLVHCVEVLHATEETVEERTAWALRLQEQLEGAQAQLERDRAQLARDQARLEQALAELACIGASRWVKLGNRFGVGPKLTGE